MLLMGYESFIAILLNPSLGGDVGWGFAYLDEFSLTTQKWQTL